MITAREWVEALRSGRYTQGTGRLKFRKDGSDRFQYCCLGVGLQEAGVESRSYSSADGYSEDEEFLVWDPELQRERYTPNTCSLSSFLVKEDAERLERLAGLHISHLVRFNDRDGLSFDEIADRIESALEYSMEAVK